VNLSSIYKATLLSLSLLLITLVSILSFYHYFPRQPNPTFTTSQTTPQSFSTSKAIKLIFAGDLSFDRYIRQMIQEHGFDHPLKDLKPLLLTADLAIVNLESPITNQPSVSLYSAIGSPQNYILTSPPQTASTLYEHNLKLVNLGNNHILNMGQAGLIQTYDYLTAANVQYFGNPGAPTNHRYIIKTIKGFNLGFVNYNQFTPNGFQTALDDIQTVNPISDLIIVIAHWGDEYQTTTNQALQALAHSFIDLGADLVIGSHPHVVQPQEVYKNKTIYYSLGNFVYDQYFSPETQKGLFVEVDINPQTKTMFYTNHNLKLSLTGQTLLDN